MFSTPLARQFLRNGASPRSLIWGSISKQFPLPKRLIQTSTIRFNKNVPIENNSNNNGVKKIDKLTLTHIPGEKKLTNELSDRVPKFPLSKENVPTLLPRPGVPRVGENGMTFGKMIHILKTKTEPELIYELEPHKLYFVFCGCFALVFAFYAWNIGIISFSLAWEIFQENNLELPVMHQYINSFVQFCLAALLTSMPLIVMMVFVMAPTRLIRRMWYIPGEVEYVQFITHPILPSRPSPVITIPLENISRAHKTKVWTGRGFYGTIDSTIFFFLREKGSRIPWIVDRKGFFWGDGRVYDYLFGKESIVDAERGLSMNDLLDILKQRVVQGEQKLKKELGVGWRYKAQAKLLTEDIKELVSDSNRLLSGKTQTQVQTQNQLPKKKNKKNKKQLSKPRRT